MLWTKYSDGLYYNLYYDTGRKSKNEVVHIHVYFAHNIPYYLAKSVCLLCPALIF